MILARAKHQAADHDPLRMADAARPRPLAIEAIAAGRDFGLAGGRRRGGDAGIGIDAPHVVLRFVGKMRQDAGVVAEIIEAPGRRTAGRSAQLDRDVEGDFVVMLVAAPALRHDGAHQAGVDVLLHRLARNVAVALRLHGALAQFRRQLARAPHQFVGGRNGLLRRRLCARLDDTHASLPDFLKIGRQLAPWNDDESSRTSSVGWAKARERRAFNR